MATKKVYYCDICGKEVPTEEDLQELSIGIVIPGVAETFRYDGYDEYHIESVEACQKCLAKTIKKALPLLNFALSRKTGEKYEAAA